MEQLGRGSIFTRGSRSEDEVISQIVQSIVTSCQYMAKRRIGALITIEQDTGVGEYSETGISIDGQLTNQLLTNIFTPNTPLHDGAVIIKNNKIIAAACYLPLSESATISKELGTRHRAALGISEVTDALTIVVSEETGAISCTKNGELLRDIDDKTLTEILTKNLKQSMKGNETTNLLSWRGRRMDKLFQNKWAIRVMSLIFAISLYLYVGIEEGNSANNNPSVIPSTGNSSEVQVLDDVPLDVKIDDDYVVSGVPEVVSVSLEGKPRILTPVVRQRNFKVFVDLRDLSEGEHTVNIEYGDIPKELKVYIEPKSIDVEIEKKRCERICRRRGFC